MKTRRLTMAWIGLALLAMAGIGCTSSEHIVGPPIHVVVAIAEPEYQTHTTLPALAERQWTPERGYQVTVITGDPAKHDMPGLIEAVESADVLVLSVRRQALPREQLQAVRDHLGAGKPLLAIRTSSHAFALRANSKEAPPPLDGRDQWPAFDAEVLGGNYHGHYPNGERSAAAAAQGAEDHPILTGVALPMTSNAGVYKNDPLAPAARPLLIARPNNTKRPPQPVAWTHRFGQAKVFYTSLGNTDDFKQPAFETLLDNAMRWLCE